MSPAVPTGLTSTTFGSPAAYAAALAAFLTEDPRIAEYRGYRAPSLEVGAAHMRGLQQLLFDEGWSRLGWPERCGGLGGDPKLRAAMFETLWDLDVVIPEPYTTLEILAPVMLVYASHLADGFVPTLLRGDESWAQAFSEPDAGSDLASLRTRMEPDGDGWRLTGQKVWSSYGHMAERSVLLARSGGPGHRGLTMVLIDLDQAGIDVRPIRAEDGENHFSEIFLDGAYLPADRVVGEVGGGWGVAMYMLQWERGAYGWLQQGRFHNRLLHALERGAAGSGGGRAALLGHAYAATTALRLQTRDTVRRLANEEVLGPEVSIDKLLLVDAETEVWDAIRDHIGPAFEFDPDLAWLRAEFLFSRAAPIYGGSQEIQRTLVAQRVLGMPREP
ncbi:MAG: acyl-CoA dehydrogenase family protein [Acidimicrobiales bacterium]